MGSTSHSKETAIAIQRNTKSTTNWATSMVERQVMLNRSLFSNWIWQKHKENILIGGGEKYYDLVWGCLYHSQWSIREKNNLIVKDKNLKSVAEEERLKAKRTLESEDMSRTPLFLHKQITIIHFLLLVFSILFLSTCLRGRSVSLNECRCHIDSRKKLGSFLKPNVFHSRRDFN